VKRRVFLTSLVFLVACSRSLPDSTPEGAVRLFIEKMETSADDPTAMKEAYALLGPRARSNLKERAERASRGQGKRFEPHEMLAEARFGLRFRTKSMATRIEGEEANVEILGEGPDEKATVKCVRENGAWRVELDLPDVNKPERRDGGT
jgi:hypothetical protein